MIVYINTIIINTCDNLNILTQMMPVVTSPSLKFHHVPPLLRSRFEVQPQNPPQTR